MSTSNKRFFLANPFDARSLARLFTQLTGKRVSEAEIADMQQRLDHARGELITLREGAHSAPSAYGQSRSQRRAGIRKRLH